MNKKALSGVLAVALVLLLVIGAVMLAGCGDPDPEEEEPEDTTLTDGLLENGETLETQTAGWGVSLTMEHARLVWREDAYLVKIEWRNLFDDGIIGDGDAVAYFFASEYSNNYYKIVVDKWGKTTYDEGEVQKSRIFENVQDFKITNWKFDSNKAINEAPFYYIQDDEKITSFFVVPGGATLGEYKNELNKTILIIQTQHQWLHLDGRTGEYLYTRTYGIEGIQW